MKKLISLLNQNTLLFIGGLAGVGHETLLTHADRPTLLILFAAMIGLPAFLSPGEATERQLRRKIEQEEEEEEFRKWKEQHKNKNESGTSQ